jgi:hypothetical protein
MSIDHLGERPDRNAWEHAASNLLFDVSAAIMEKAPKKVHSSRVVLTDHLQHIRDRSENDVHLFLELHNGKVFHIKIYLAHMIRTDPSSLNVQVMLTAYQQDTITLHGGEHSLRQGWYPWNATNIAQSIVEQNPDLFG